MKIKRIILFSTLFIFAMIATSCSFKKEEPVVNRQTYLMGTIIDLKIYGKNAKEASEKCVDKISEIENKMSTNIDTSEISKINKNAGIAPIKVSKNTLAVIKSSLYYSNKTKGTFDITVEPLVRLWGIGTDKARVPSLDEIKEKLKLINYKDIIIDEKNSTIMLKNKGQAIDLGAIAKGYTADEVKKILIENNIKSAFVSLGGNIYVLGNKTDNSPWNIAIRNPINPGGDYLGMIPLSNKSIVTSGNYERYFEKDGKRYHHIFDTSTGYPAEKGLISVSIISDKSIDGDALSTSVYTLGLKDGMHLIESLKGVEAVFVTKDKKVYITSGLKNKFKLNSTNFTLIKE